MKETRGGKRENSGAKPKGNMQYQRRINPALVQMMDEYLNQLKNKNYKKLVIELKDWHYTCGDGCCYTYGMDIYLNGEKLKEQHAEESSNALKVVLEKLGYEVEIN